MKQLLITLPVYNESLIIEKNTKKVHDFCSKNFSDFDWKILIADNGSTDDTLAKSNELAKIFPNVAVFHTDKKGRGQALRRAWTDNDSDFYAYMDIDLAVNLEALKPLVWALENDAADIAIGSRYDEASKVERSILRETTSRVYNWLVNLILKLPIRDTQCGFKGVSQKVIKTILPKTNDDIWFWDTELLAIAFKQGYKIKEIPVDWVETRTKGRKSKVALIRTICNYLWNLFKLKKRIRKSHPEH